MLSTWTDYDGDNTYGDFTVTAGVVIDGTGYELGLAQINRPTPTTFDTLYAHNDHLGTLRGQSNSSGFTGSYPVHTAFGEKMSNDSQRFGYAGSSGYQTNVNFDSLHVGARYYDPSTGRFLQRDPLGIRAGINVYLYVDANPLICVDPSGLQVASPIPPYYAAGGAAAAKEAAETAAFLACAFGAADRRPRLGDRVDGTPTYTNPKYPRVGRNPNKSQKGVGHSASYPLFAMLVILMAYAGTQVFHRRSRGKRGRVQA